MLYRLTSVMVQDLTEVKVKKVKLLKYITEPLTHSIVQVSYIPLFTTFMLKKFV